MVESKPSCPHEGNELKIPTDRNKGKPSKPKKYRGKKQPKNKPILEPKNWNLLPGPVYWLGRLHFWPWTNSICKIIQNNEGTGSIPWNNVQWQLSASHHDWNCGQLPWPRYAYHHWVWPRAPINRWRDELPWEKEYRWFHPPKVKEEGCLQIRHAQYLQSDCGVN